MKAAIAAGAILALALLPSWQLFFQVRTLREEVALARGWAGVSDLIRLSVNDSSEPVFELGPKQLFAPVAIELEVEGDLDPSTELKLLLIGPDGSPAWRTLVTVGEIARRIDDDGTLMVLMPLGGTADSSYRLRVLDGERSLFESSFAVVRREDRVQDGAR